MERNLINIEDYEDYKAYTNNNKEKLIASVREKLKSIDSNYSIYEITAFIDSLFTPDWPDIKTIDEAKNYIDIVKRRDKIRELFLELRYINKNPLQLDFRGETIEQYEKRIVYIQEREAKREKIYNKLKRMIATTNNDYLKVAFPDLASEDAKRLFSKAVEVGLLDSSLYQPTMKTNREKAVLALVLAKELCLETKVWKIFEPFWGIKNLAVSYAQKVKNWDKLKKETEYKKLLGLNT